MTTDEPESRNLVECRQLGDRNPLIGLHCRSRLIAYDGNEFRFEAEILGDHFRTGIVGSDDNKSSVTNDGGAPMATAEGVSSLVLDGPCPVLRFGVSQARDVLA